MYNIPRLVVGAAQGRSGKTTFTLGLLRALKNRGVDVQPFKKGPDYIDPSWMTYAAATPCRNLDAVMMGEEQIIHSLVKHTKNRDIAVIEGAMGIFDGLDVEGSNSTAQLAYMTKSPVILIVNGQRITRSVAAIINGVIAFDTRIQVIGVVLNQIARPRHLNIMTQSIERYCNVPILGALPKSKQVEIPDRHLGLIPAGEQAFLQDRVEFLAQLVEEHVDIDRILSLAATAPPLADPLIATATSQIGLSPRVKIGVMRDRAFSFYYPENLEALVEAGAELVDINGLEDPHLPALGGLYIGGGFPEVMAAELSANSTLRQDILAAAQDGMPIYAECGGLMYLSRQIITADGTYPMVGFFAADVQMEKKPQGHGYAIQEVQPGHPFFSAGRIIKGHEFHNSRLINLATDAAHFGYHTQRGKGIIPGFDGLIRQNTFAAYHHFHAASDPEWAEMMVAQCREYTQK